MKKLLVLAGILCCLFFSFSGCGGGDSATEDEVGGSMGAAAVDAEEAESLMDQAKDAADDAEESAKELADEAGEAMKELAD